MQNILIDKPYVPVPPYRGRIWPKILLRYLPRLLRKKYGVSRVECVDAQLLGQSIAAGHGVMLTPNHCRDEDPLVLGSLSREVGAPFFIMASWHIFMQDRMQAFLLRRAGAFSVYREGIDRTAVNTAVEILENARRPLIIFPEGLVTRTNDAAQRTVGWHRLHRPRGRQKMRQADAAAQNRRASGGHPLSL